MSEFEKLDVIEKTATAAALDRCRALAARIDRELRKKKAEHFDDVSSLAEFLASLEQAASVLEGKCGLPKKRRA